MDRRLDRWMDGRTDGEVIWKSSFNVLYLNQAKDLLIASHWGEICLLEKLFCLSLIFFLDFFVTAPYLESRAGQTAGVYSFV